MADTVNAQLERMLPELEDLEKWGLFTRPEIKEIVRRRREFEYQLKRPSRIKDDYLRYIEYEKQLEQLRKIRKKAVLVDLKAAGKSWTGHLCDRASTNRIIGIYKRGVARFPNDLGLWLQYLEFSRLNSPSHMRRALAKAVQLHPHVPGLWMYAAQWDFEENLNVTAARALMQRGLRMCPRSEDLWVEYFRMELTYAHKLKARKLVLGIDAKDKNTNAEQESELSVKLARVIYRNAIASIPSSSRFRQRFIEVLDECGYSLSAVEDEIFASIMKEFPKDESSYDWKAKRCLKNCSWENAVQVYEDGLRAVSSSHMFELYAKFLESLLDSEHIPDSENIQIADKLCQIYEISEKTCPSVNLVESHVQLLARQGLLEKARELCMQFLSGNMRESSRLWILRISLEVQCSVLLPEDIHKLFISALKLVEFPEATQLWHMAIEFFTGKEASLENILRLLEGKLAGKGAGQAAATVACCAVDWFLHSTDIQKTRQFYNRLLVLPGASLQLYEHCINIEAERATLGDRDALQCMRRLFDSATEIYGKHNMDLWLNYCAWERKFGNADAASTVYYRARKTLSDPAMFIQKHQLLFC